jgi:hypothetical protein
LNAERFNEVKEELRLEAEGIATAKRPGYTQGNVDVLKNFKRAGEFAGVTALQAWSVYAWKHMAAILTYAKDPTIPQAEPILGRAADLRNYLDLFMGLVDEDAEQRALEQSAQ